MRSFAPISTDTPQALDSPLLDLLNVRYVVTTEEIDSPKYKLAYDGEVRIYENLGCMPRAFAHIYVWSGVWQSAGWGTIVFLAALAAVLLILVVPDDLRPARG